MLVKDKEIMKEEGGNYRHFYKDNICATGLSNHLVTPFSYLFVKLFPLR